MPHIDDPYSETMLAHARQEIVAAHHDSLSIIKDCYARLCARLSGAEYEVGTADEATLALSARVLELAAMSITCLRSGSVPSAKILIRATLEASYKISAICKTPKNVEQFVDDDIASRLLQNKKIHEYKKDKGIKSLAKGIEKKIDELAAKKAKKIETVEWASRAGMMDFHRLFYAWLSADTHGNAAAIDHYFDPKRDYALEIGPSDIDLPMATMILSRCLLVTLRALNSNPDEQSTVWYASIETRLTALEAK